MVDPVQIAERTELVKAQNIEVGSVLGGISISSVADVAKIADLLSRGMVAVPQHCRNEPGVCFALSLQALEWRMPIMSVINKSYVPRGGDRIGYEFAVAARRRREECAAQGSPARVVERRG